MTAWMWRRCNTVSLAAEPRSMSSPSPRRSLRPCGKPCPTSPGSSCSSSGGRTATSITDSGSMRRLRSECPSAPERVPRWIDWHELASTEAIAAAAAGEPALAVRGVPNARVRQELSALARIVDQRNGADDAESDERQTSVVEPEEIWALAGRLDCEVVVSPSTEDPRGAVDVLLHRCEPRGDLCVRRNSGYPKVLIRQRSRPMPPIRCAAIAPGGSCRR